MATIQQFQNGLAINFPALPIFTKVAGIIDRSTHGVEKTPSSQYDDI
jgi:hypothetical protein